VYSPSHFPDPHAPVLVGVGTASDNVPVTELMARASLAAGHDAGAPGLLQTVDRIAFPQGSWTLANPARQVAERIGSAAAHTSLFELGVSQQEMINRALADIASGDADVVLVVGGEARAFERAHPDANDALEPTDAPDAIVTRPADFVAPIEIAAGIVWPPVQQYALIDNALAQSEHQSPAAHHDDVARLWARFNRVAQGNPLAAFGTPRTASSIAEPGPKNRPLAYPYNLWHSSQWTVDQAAALLFCSTEAAERAMVPKDRWIFPRVALHSSSSVTLTARRHLFQWPAMATLGRAATDHLGLSVSEFDITELYSCFPAAVRVQQRALGLDPEGTPTITGGMTFAGGPFNNFVLQSTAAVVHRLRQAPAQLGLVTTVSGMLSKPGLAVWSATPPEPGRGPLVADLAVAADAATDTCPVATLESADGPATVVSFTVTGAADNPFEPSRTVVVADLADGQRTAATCEDASIAHHALDESLIGHTVQIAQATFAL